MKMLCFSLVILVTGCNIDYDAQLREFLHEEAMHCQADCEALGMDLKEIQLRYLTTSRGAVCICQ